MDVARPYGQIQLFAQLCSSAITGVIVSRHIFLSQTTSQDQHHQHQQHQQYEQQQHQSTNASTDLDLYTSRDSTDDLESRRMQRRDSAQPRPPLNNLSPATKILRACAMSDFVFSFSGVCTSLISLYADSFHANLPGVVPKSSTSNPSTGTSGDKSEQPSVMMIFWIVMPHLAFQVASFLWINTLALYMVRGKTNHQDVDVPIAHAVIWMITCLYWMLGVYGMFYHQQLIIMLSVYVVWKVFAALSFGMLCWSLYVCFRRWQQQMHQKPSIILSKLMAYTLFFFLLVIPAVLTDLYSNNDFLYGMAHCLYAFWPCSNALVYMSRRDLLWRLFFQRFGRRSMDPDDAHGERDIPMLEDQLSHQLMSPTTNELKGLEVGEKIGEGIAVVYRGKWRGADVAVKMKALVLDPLANLEEFQQECNLEIQKEAQVMKTLMHPNIVLFMEAGFYKGSICIVSEFCQRGSLRDVLQWDQERVQIPNTTTSTTSQQRDTNVSTTSNNSKWSQRPKALLVWPMKIRLAIGIANGIQYLHNAHPPMIHRDLKSPNVLVDKSWRAKIADFGTLRFAEIVSGARQSKMESSELAVMTGLVGTTRWMAPEVMRGEKLYTHKVDIYSLGLILWEMIEGQLPFENIRWNYEIEDFVLKGKRPDIPFNKCPVRWRALVTSCWQSDPAKRPSIQQVIRTLNRIAKEEVPQDRTSSWSDVESMYNA